MRQRQDKKWDEVRDLLGLPGTMHFNREKARGGGLKKLKGDPVGCALAKPAAFGKRWWTLAEHERDRIIETLLARRGEPEALAEIGSSQWGLSPELGEAGGPTRARGAWCQPHTALTPRHGEDRGQAGAGA